MYEQLHGSFQWIRIVPIVTPLILSSYIRWKRKQIYGTYAQFFPSFLEASSWTRNELSSSDRQTRVWKHPQNVLLSTILEETTCTIREALKEIGVVVESFARRESRINWSEEYKAEYLFDAAITKRWAQSASSHCYTSTATWNLQQLYNAWTLLIGNTENWTEVALTKWYKKYSEEI